MSVIPDPQETDVALGNTQQLPADVRQRNAGLAREFISWWRENSSSERDEGNSHDDSRVVDIADNELIDSIVALFRDRWVIPEGEVSRPVGRAMWAEEEDDVLIEYVVGPLRAQLLREVDNKVRAIATQVHVALAIHRAFTMS